MVHGKYIVIMVTSFYVWMDMYVCMCACVNRLTPIIVLVRCYFAVPALNLQENGIYQTREKVGNLCSLISME